MRPRPVQVSARQAILAIVDMLLVLIALLLAWALRTLDVRVVGHVGMLLDIRTGATTLTIIVHLLSFYVFELYNPIIDFRRAAGLARVIAAIAAATATLIALFYIVPFWRLSRGIVLIQSGLLLTFVWSWRVFASKRWTRRQEGSRTLIIGAGRLAKLVVEAVAARPDRNVVLVGFLDDDPDKQAAPGPGELPVLGETACVGDKVDELNVDTVIVAIKQPREAAFARDVLALKSRGVRVIHGATLYKYFMGRVPILYVDDFYFLFGPDLDRLRSPLQRNLHRLFDIAVSFFGLIVSSPLLLSGMLLVKLTSRGPVFYRQERVGLNKRSFDILKLRTMEVNAERETGAVMSKPGSDPRVTRVGRWLRRSRIDELPQLFNVLRGDMSFIGPRPERPIFTTRFEQEIPYYALRFAVKPGLTGWAQVNFRYGSDAADTAVKLQYDLYYIQEMGFLLDMHIILKTIQTVLFRSGS